MDYEFVNKLTFRIRRRFKQNRTSSESSRAVEQNVINLHSYCSFKLMARTLHSLFLSFAHFSHVRDLYERVTLLILLLQNLFRP